MDTQNIPSPSGQGVGGLVPGNNKYSRLATTGSPSHGYVASTQELIQQQIR